MAGRVEFGAMRDCVRQANPLSHFEVELEIATVFARDGVLLSGQAEERHAQSMKKGHLNDHECRNRRR